MESGDMIPEPCAAAEVLGPEEVGRIVSVLWDAFFDYPVMRYVLGSSDDYASRLEELITFFVMARVFRGEILLGVRDGDRLLAAALVSFPDGTPADGALLEMREDTWRRLGLEARTRYEAFAAAAARFTVEAPHVHLNMIGVRRAEQGRRLGRLILDAVHEFSSSRDGSEGVTLSTELASNVPLYEHFGYYVLGWTRVDPTLTTWAMHRPNPEPVL